MSLQVRTFSDLTDGRHLKCTTAAQMHYNQGGDLLTYLVDPSVFDVRNGYVEALQGSL